MNFDWQSSAILKAIEKDPHLNPSSCHLQWSRVQTNAASRSQIWGSGVAKHTPPIGKRTWEKKIGFVMMHHDMSWFTEFLVIRGSIKTRVFFAVFGCSLYQSLYIPKSTRNSRLARCGTGRSSNISPASVHWIGSYWPPQWLGSIYPQPVAGSKSNHQPSTNHHLGVTCLVISCLIPMFHHFFRYHLVSPWKIHPFLIYIYI